MFSRRRTNNKVSPTNSQATTPLPSPLPSRPTSEREMSGSGSESDASGQGTMEGVVLPPLKRLSRLEFPDLPNFPEFQKRFNNLLEKGEAENDVDWDSVVNTYNDSKEKFNSLQESVTKIVDFFDIQYGYVIPESTPNLTDLSLIAGALIQTSGSLSQLQYSLSEVLDSTQKGQVGNVSSAMTSTRDTLAIDKKFSTENESKIVTLKSDFAAFAINLAEIQTSVDQLEKALSFRLRSKIQSFSSGLLGDQLNNAKAVSKETFESMSSAELPLYRADGLLSTINYFDQIFLPTLKYTILDIQPASAILPNVQGDFVFVRYQQGDSVRVSVAETRTDSGNVINVPLNTPFTENELKEDSIISVKKDGKDIEFLNQPRYLEKPNKERPGQDISVRFEDYNVIPRFSNYLVTLGEGMKTLLLEAKKVAEQTKQDIETTGQDSNETRKSIQKMKDFASKFLEDGKSLSSSSRAEGSLLPESRPGGQYRGGIHIPAYGRAMQLKELMG